MFLDFLEAPSGTANWLGYGGAETLMSYGMSPDHQRQFNLPGRDLKHMVRATVPESHLSFLRALPVSLRLPGYLICHAGLNPDVGLAEQQDDDFLWQDPAALDASPPNSPARAEMARTGLRLIHGHVPYEDVALLPHRIGVDTGAYGSGCLSAVCLQPDHTPEVLSVTL